MKLKKRNLFGALLCALIVVIAIFSRKNRKSVVNVQSPVCVLKNKRVEEKPKVTGKTGEHGRKYLTDAEKKKIRKMYRDGKSVKEIAEDIPCQLNSVWRNIEDIRRRKKLNPQKTNGSIELPERLYLMLKKVESGENKVHLNKRIKNEIRLFFANTSATRAEISQLTDIPQVTIARIVRGINYHVRKVLADGRVCYTPDEIAIAIHLINSGRTVVSVSEELNINARKLYDEIHKNKLNAKLRNKK